MILRSPTETENVGKPLHRGRSPFPLTGKGRDRGAQRITPTFILPRRGEGMKGFFRLPRRIVPQRGASRNFKGGYEEHEVKKFKNINVRNLRVLRPFAVKNSLQLFEYEKKEIADGRGDALAPV